MTIIWEDPPAEALEAQHRKGTLGAWLMEIKQRPGVWARLDREYASIESARAAASSIKTGKAKGINKGDFEAIAHESPKPTVWARYVRRQQSGDVQLDHHEQQRRVFAAQVRTWARTKGIEVPERGRISEEVVRRYESETGLTRPAAPPAASSSR